VTAATKRVRAFRIRKRADLKPTAFVYGVSKEGSKAEREAKEKLLFVAQSFNRKSARELEAALKLCREERDEAIRIVRLFTLEDMHGGRYEAVRQFVAKFEETK